MASVTAEQKRNAIKALVVDTVRPRIIALRQECDDHWKAIVEEIFSAMDLEKSAEIVNLIVENQDLMRVTAVDSYDDPVILFQDDELRVREITRVKCTVNNTDPFGVWNPRGYVGLELITVWRETGRCC